MSICKIPGVNITLAILSADQAALVSAYYAENRAHLEPWEPKREEEFYGLAETRARLEAAEANFHNGTSYSFAILERRTGKMIGICNFSNVVRGVFQACHLGYAIAAEFEGKGFMSEALRLGISYMFETVGLHRIMANYMPHNVRSAALLAKLGFEKEGYAKSYLKIGGKWQDHVLSSLVNPKSA
jgi:[ribosomal protein S5]-alanine N-acetyltransferase